VLFDSFDYVKPIAVAGIVPDRGTASGGTIVTIKGDGFGDPRSMQIRIGGGYVALINVTPTEITAITTQLFDDSCSDHTGVVRVTNFDTGDAAEGPAFTYIAAPPRFISIPPLISGQLAYFGIADGWTGQFTFGDIVVDALGLEGFKDGVSTLLVRVPEIEFPIRTCSDGGAEPAAVRMPLTFRNIATGCTTTTSVLILPPAKAPRCDPPTVRPGRP